MAITAIWGTFKVQLIQAPLWLLTKGLYVGAGFLEDFSLRFEINWNYVVSNNLD